MDCGCGAQVALPTMRSWLRGYLGAHMGREWGKRRRKFSHLLFCCVNWYGPAWSASVSISACAHSQKHIIVDNVFIVVVTYVYNIHAVRTHSTDRTVSNSSRAHHIYDIYAFIILCL